MNIGHIWMFSAYIAWMEIATGAWLFVPRQRKPKAKA